MEKQTLSNYGWIVVVTLVLSVMLALATPFGTYVGDGVVAIANGFVGASDTAIDEDNIANLQNKWDNKLNPQPILDPALNPDDGTEPQAGDIYTYGDYEYCYGYGWCGDCCDWSNICGCNYTTNGWGVRVVDDTKTEYGAILESINGQPVTNMRFTFDYCTSLKTAPAIPSSVTDMYGTFYGCTSLEIAPTIPSSVTNMHGTFEECTSLTTAPTIPNSVTDMYATFYGCTELKTYVGSTDADGDFSNYIIPSSVTDMSSTFYKCTSLTTAPVIPNSVRNMHTTFQGCTALETAPVIPSSVTDMYYTFYRCTSLKTAPIIPSSVTRMDYTFSRCTSLTGNIEINANPTSYDNCFYNTIKPITLSGTSTKLAEIAATADNGNVKVAE